MERDREGELETSKEQGVELVKHAALLQIRKRLKGALVDVQMEDVGTGVVTDDVEDQTCRGRYRPESSSATWISSPSNGIHQHVAQRPDDEAPAADQHRRRVVALDGAVVRRTIAAGQILAGREDEAAALEGDVRMVGSQVSRSSTVGAQ